MLKKHGPGGCCCGEPPCDCPRCAIFGFSDGCLLRWNCCSEGATFHLEGSTIDHGNVESSGVISYIVGDTYTMTVSKDGCDTIVYETEPAPSCGCSSGCLTGRVEKARSLATMTVTRFGTVTGVTGPNPGTFTNCRITRSVDLSGLNHTKTFPVLIKEYSGCAFEYIDQAEAEYYIGAITSSVTVDNGTSIRSGSATFEAYGSCQPTGVGVVGVGPDGVTLQMPNYRIRVTRTSSSPVDKTGHCSGGGTEYALGDGPGAGSAYSEHFFVTPPAYNMATGTYPQNGVSIHPPWCHTDGAGNEKYTIGLFSGFGMSIFTTPVNGLFVWEGMY